MTIYYVDFTAGSDSQNGTEQTHTTGTTGPWKTIGKVNGSSFSADDQILLKRGETWRNDKLIFPSSGTSGHPIIIDAYGSGALPRILGPSTLGAWTDTGGNVWNITLTQGGAPQAVWFVHGDGSVNWGKKAATLGALAAEYDWFWSANVLSIFSPTNPGTRYTSVEPSSNITNQAVNLSSLSYVTVKNVETAYWGGYGIALGLCIGVIVDSCLVHHIGVKNGSEAEGIAFYASDTCTARNNVVHDTGNHGIQTSCSGVGLSTLNILFEHNIIYDSYHSMIDNQCQNGTVNGIIIRDNFIYISSVYDTTYAAGAIWVLGEFGHDMTGVQIYGNVICNLQATAIIIRDKVPSPVIYNNTIYGTPGTFDNSSTGIGIGTLGTYFPSGVVIKNNVVSECFNYAWNTSSASYISAVDYNCWYKTSGNVVKIGATSYTVAQLATYRSDTGYDAHGLFSDPKFVNPTPADPATADLSLQSSSPCINAGVSVGLTTDYNGVSIPQGAAPDMGAFEFVTSGQAPTAPSGLQVHWV